MNGPGAVRPRVAICTDGVFPLAMGGMQRHSRLLVEHLARSGEVDLIVLHPHPTGVFSDLPHVEEMPLPPIDTGKFYLRELWRYSRHVEAALHRLQPDVVLSQGFSVWAGAHTFRDKLIFHPHGLEMFQGLTTKERMLGLPFRMLVQHLARQARCTISLGGKLTAILRSIGARQVVVLPNAVDVPQQPSADREPGDAVRFLFVGRFAFNKGIDLLMHAAQRLAKEQVPARFQLAGDGPLLRQYRAEGLPPNVELLGRVDDEHLFQLYADSDCFVLPTRFEGMPTVVLEAMARACPVVVSDVGATADLVTDGLNGLLLPAGDAEALYRGLVRFCRMDAAQRRAMGQAGHTLARQRFDWPQVARGYIALFRGLTGPDR